MTELEKEFEAISDIFNIIHNWKNPIELFRKSHQEEDYNQKLKEEVKCLLMSIEEYCKTKGWEIDDVKTRSKQ